MRVKMFVIIATVLMLLCIPACAKKYKVGDIGPAGGIVFYDKGEKAEGWRYLEVAPVATEFKAAWGYHRTAVNGTNVSIGSGKQNTDIIASMGDTNSAAYICKQLEVKGYKDWFLPSKDELEQMQKVLYSQNLGDFSGDEYWSSSVWDEDDDHEYNSEYSTWLQRFSDGVQGYSGNYYNYYRSSEMSVRAIRAFGGTKSTSKTLTNEQTTTSNAEVTPASNPAEPEVVKVAKKPVEPGLASIDDLKSNWAWVITNYSDNNQMVAIEYSQPEALERLTLAIDRMGIYQVNYAGQKTATGTNGDYGATFEGVAGPYWKIADGSTVEGGQMLLLPETCHKGILPLTPFENDTHPPASQADIAKIRALKPGRGMMNSEMLATDSRGGRIGLFQFNNTAEEGLFILAYIHGEKVITLEFTTDLYDGQAYWRADADPDDICYFEATALCETDEGLVIAFLWGAPEGTGNYILIEKDGKFVDFITDARVYDHWSNSWLGDEQEE